MDPDCGLDLYTTRVYKKSDDNGYDVMLNLAVCVCVCVCLCVCVLYSCVCVFV